MQHEVVILARDDPDLAARAGAIRAVERACVGSGVGVGLVHRVAREVQGRFVLEPQRETSRAAAPPIMRSKPRRPAS